MLTMPSDPTVSAIVAGVSGMGVGCVGDIWDVFGVGGVGCGIVKSLRIMQFMHELCAPPDELTVIYAGIMTGLHILCRRLTHFI